MSLSVINLDAIRNAPLISAPYEHIIGSGFLQAEAIHDLRQSFPDIKEAGFHPASDMELTGEFRTLISELEGSAVTQALSEKFGQDFNIYPRLVTIRRLSAAHEGRIHCDSKRKIMSLLVYMNDSWETDAGKLRVLNNGRDMDDYVSEINPHMGNIFAFLRTDHSWHGHPSFTGERKVIQVAWVRDQEAIDDKKKRHRLSLFFKRIFN